jgi:hypothetical protein
MLRRLLLPFASMALWACTATSNPTNFTGGAGGSGGVEPTSTSGSGGLGGTSGMTSTGVGFFDGGPTGSGTGGAPPMCAQETQYVYVITSDNQLFRFDPPSLAFAPIGVINCPNANFGSPFSMAVSRDAVAYVVFTDGYLYKVDTKTAACTKTNFAPGQHGFSTFGMGFSTNMPGGTDETLYVSESSFGGTTMGLAKIDLQSMILTPIGMYDKANARAEMTGTGDARLFGAFEGMPYVVSEIDKSNAKILSQAPQDPISYPPGGSNFAFAFWGGDFWLFAGPGSYTDVFQYKPSDGSTTKRITVQLVIVGAGVSTCAPIVPPS